MVHFCVLRFTSVYIAWVGWSFLGFIDFFLFLGILGMWCIEQVGDRWSVVHSQDMRWFIQWQVSRLEYIAGIDPLTLRCNVVPNVLFLFIPK